MQQLKPNYVMDAGNKKIAVQLSIKTFEQIEEVLENYGLYKFMQEDREDESLNLQDAKAYYNELKKKK
jgi:hypothetical protein